MNLPGADNYSNGYKLQTVLTALTGRIGWRQPTLSTFTTTLSTDNLASKSGRYFQDFHPVCSPDVIKSIQEDNNISDDDFNALLVNQQQAAIIKALNGVLNKRELIEQKLLFERFGRQDYQNPNAPNTFVGVLIRPPRDFHKSVQIDSISLYFDSVVTFPLYLFHDAKRTHLWTQQVTTIAWNQTIINFDQFILNSLEGNKSGVFYLGYFQDDLGSAQAINEIIQKLNTFYCFGTEPVELNRRVSDGTTPQVDVNNVRYTIKTHGLNLQYSSFRDHTQEIINNPYLFDELIGLEMAAMIIEMIGYTGRTNKNERINKFNTQELLNDLNGVPNPYGGAPVVIGLKNQIQKEAYRVKHNIFPKPKITTFTHDTDIQNVYGIPKNSDNFYY